MLDPIRERFVQEYAVHGNASEAYRTANPRAKKWKDNSVHPKASAMLADGKVQTRLSEIQAAACERNNVTIDSITAELEEARSLALTEKQSSAAVSASMGKAKLHGLLVDKQEQSGPDGGALQVHNRIEYVVVDPKG